VTRDQIFSPSDPKLNGLPGLIVEHFFVKFGDLAASVFETSCGEKDRQTELKTLPHAIAVGMGNELIIRRTS